MKRKMKKKKIIIKKDNKFVSNCIYIYMYIYFPFQIRDYSDKRRRKRKNLYK